MKALRLKVCRSSSARNRVKARLRAHAVFLYRLRMETQSVDVGLLKRPRAPTKFLLRGVSQEAARLSARTRRRVITQREVVAALEQLRRRRRAVPMDGA
ncbi:hypothetical protein AOLI_G00288680 [Acnodon oligacanthus]